MSDTDLRTSLRDLAAEASVVDLRSRVLDGTRRSIRRRRAVAAAGVALVLAAISVSLVPTLQESDSPPASPGPRATVDLGSARIGGTPGAVLAVSDIDTGDTWLVARDGDAARLRHPIPSFPGRLMSLSGDGGFLATGSGGRATVVDTTDGTVTPQRIGGQDEFVPAVSPAGDIFAYAKATSAGVVLTLRIIGESGETTVDLPVDNPAGDLLPVLWSRDGSSLLVLDSATVTRVRIAPGPPAVQDVSFLSDQVVLASGWAASPDLARVAMSEPGSIDRGLRRWRLLDPDTGRSVAQLTRPFADRLIGWTGGDRLVWWHHAGGGYQVSTTDLAGSDVHRLLTIPSTAHSLRAVWAR